MFEKIITVDDRQFVLQSEKNPGIFSFVKVRCEGALAEYQLTVNPNENIKPLSIKWSNHMVGLLSFWSPTAGRDRGIRQWYNANTNISNMYYGAPVLSVIHQGNQNFSTVAVSDAINTVRMTFSVNDFEEKENLDFHIHLFESGCNQAIYTLRIRIDERKIPYYDAIASVSKWWKAFYPMDKKTKKYCELPLYSSWYNYHQHPEQMSLEKEMEEAVRYGFQSLIIDDGWSYDGNGHGDYRDCGNWKVSETKFPDMKGFVEKLHGLGVKVAVWFPVPFLGYCSKDYDRFRNKMLYNDDKQQAGVVDPRYPEVRKYIVDTYVDMVNKYNLDGLKLDFIDSFRCEDESLLCTDKSSDYDCDAVEEGVIRLLREIREALTTTKPDFMIEFRQFYVGPAIVRDCNMLRVIDCPFDYVTNRVGIVDLRLMNYDLAVHADMLIWAKDEKIEVCSKMLLNILFGVPQISVLLQHSREEQKQVIGHYIKYWNKNREVILHGDFKAYNPEECYSFVSSENSEKRIAVVYSSKVCCFDGKAMDIFNATAYDYLYIDNVSDKNVTATSYDCMGNQMEKTEIRIGVCKVQVPEGGYVMLR